MMMLVPWLLVPWLLAGALLGLAYCAALWARVRMLVRGHALAAMATGLAGMALVAGGLYAAARQGALPLLAAAAGLLVVHLLVVRRVKRGMA